MGDSTMAQANSGAAPLTLSRWFDAFWRMMRRDWFVVLLLGPLISWGPMRLYYYSGYDLPFGSAALTAVAVGVAALLLQALRTGFVAGAILSPAPRLTGRLARGAGALRESLLPVIALSAVASLPATILLTLLRLYGLSRGGPVTPALGLLSLAQGVWAIAYPILFFTAAPVAVSERRGPLSALRRAFRLGQGWRWRLAGVIVLYVLAYSVLALFLRYGPRSMPTRGADVGPAVTAFFLVIGFTQVVVANLLLVFSAAAYRVLTVGAEPEVASVFD